ncbi:ribonuclease HI family protein [bacterium]|nr:MAG: ribonuclease HI family protein [bacterium]
MSGRIRVHGDGGSRGNPGPAAAAAVLLTASGEIIEKRSEFMGVATNNQAEYLAVELGLRALHELGHTQADFFLDSQLVVRQLNGQYKVKHPDMKLAFDRIQKLKKGLDVTFTHVLRADNAIADTVVNECLDAHL